MAPTAGRIVWLGHATVLIELDGVRVLTDPLLRGWAVHLRRKAPLAAEPLERLDAVLISHVHWDHLDLRSLDRLGHGTRVILPRGAGSLLSRRGFTDVTELDEGDEIAVGDGTVRATHAEHDADRGPFGVRAASLGFLVERSVSVYFAGDTDLFDGMRSIAPALDVALLPVAGWGSKIPEGHLTAEAAAEALALIKPRIAIPIHWGTFAPVHRRQPFHADAGHVFAAKARTTAPDVDVRVLRVGEASAI
jgi:L-ascorbate metabolism protein UlaG (beta-lactamase superfamily)